MATRGSKEPPVPADLQARLDTLAAQTWTDDDDNSDASSSLAGLLAEWKAVGNACYAAGCFLAAIRCYTKLIALPGGDTAAIRSNRSAAYLQSPMHAGPSLAVKDAEKAVELEPMWFKGHLRVGDAQRLRGNVVEADVAYRHTLTLEPTCAGAQAGLRALQELVQDSMPASNSAINATSASASPAAAAAAASLFSSAPQAPRFDGRPELRGDGRSATARDAPPITPEQQLEGWKRETCVREDRTGMRPRPVSLTEADRQQGVAIKQALLDKFRSKVATDETLSDTLRERREEAVLSGEGVDYREAERYRTVYAHSTNGIGLGISTDAYKEHTGQVDHRTW